MRKIIVFLFLCVTLLYPKAVDIMQNGVSLLDKSEVYIDKNDVSLSQIIKEKRFQPYEKEFIRIGTSKNKVWIALTLKNDTDKIQEKIVLFGTPFVENIYFYDELDLLKPDIKGQAHPRKDHKTQLHYYPVKLQPHSAKRYYVRVNSDYTYLNFKVTLEDEQTYIDEDRESQVLHIFLIGFIFALMVYSFFISIYIKDKSYFFYGTYLIPLLLYQLKFVGLTQIYFSSELIELDLQATIVRVYFLLITNALFAMHFLDIKRYKKLYRVFIIFLTVAVSSMILFHEPNTIGLRLSSILGLFLMLFNLGVGIYVYKKGYKQARLYITGFVIVFFSYLGLITDSMGISSVLLYYPSIFLWGTAFEALVLSLAFADRYVILQKEKEETYRLFLQESRNREQRVAAEVQEKTIQLSSAIETKELLLQEVHHRVKNNLQIILSLIQLQTQGIKDKVYLSIMNDIGNRVNAIAKTYEMLIVDDDLHQIDMKPYMESLVSNICRSFDNSENGIELVTNIDVSLPLKEAAYVGLIANEIITNAYKYAFEDGKGKISIDFNSNEGNYELIIEDNGKGFDIAEVKESLGLMLIKVLATDQLKGKIDIHSNDKTRYEISFTLPQGVLQT